VLLRLIIQSIKKDLASTNEVNQSLALCTIANVGGQEFAENLTADVQTLLLASYVYYYHITSQHMLSVSCHSLNRWIPIVIATCVIEHRVHLFVKRLHYVCYVYSVNIPKLSQQVIGLQSKFDQMANFHSSPNQ
jgi:hypothetical protein